MTGGGVQRMTTAAQVAPTQGTVGGYYVPQNIGVQGAEGGYPQGPGIQGAAGFSGQEYVQEQEHEQLYMEAGGNGLHNENAEYY